MTGDTEIVYIDFSMCEADDLKVKIEHSNQADGYEPSRVTVSE